MTDRINSLLENYILLNWKAVNNVTYVKPLNTRIYHNTTKLFSKNNIITPLMVYNDVQAIKESVLKDNK